MIAPPPLRYRRGRFSPSLVRFIAYGFRAFSALALLLFLAFSAVSAQAQTLTLENNDTSVMPTISIRGSPKVHEGNNLSFILKASPAPTQDLDVTVAIADAPGNFLKTAAEGDRTVTIPANKAEQTFKAQALNDDSVDEPSGDVTATVKPGAGYTVGTDSSWATRVVDCSETTVTFLGGVAGNITEGNARTIRIMLNRGLAKGEQIEVTLLAAGTATRGTDYTFAGATATGVSFNLNDDSKDPKVTFTGPKTGVSAKEATITLIATADAVAESTGETAIIRIKGILHGGLGTLGAVPGKNTPVTFRIIDQKISIAPGSGVDEGAAASFTVRASAAPSSDLDVTVNIEDDATSDFVTTTNEGSKMVTIAAGQRTATYSVATVADNTDEPNGNVTATIESGSYQVSSTSAAASVAVADDDATTLALAAQTAGNVTEGDAKTLTLTLGRALVAGEKLTAPLAFAGAATRGADYTLAGAPQAGVAYNNLNSGSASVVFTGPSPTATTITFSASADNASEGSETVEIGLGALATTGLGGGATGTNNLPSFDIEDPGADPTITISAGSGVTEGTALSFTLTANPAPTQALDVAVTIADAANSDFVPSAGENARTVTIDANSATKTFTVATTADTADEPNGKVTATVTNGSGYAVGSPASAEVAVDDNDATTVTLSTPDKTATEDDAAETATLTLTLSRALTDGEALAAPLQFTGGEAGTHFTLTLSGTPAGVTFDAPSSTVTFEGSSAPSATEATLTLAAQGDADAADRTVTVSIPASSTGASPTLAATNLGGGATGERAGDGEITITDDDEAQVSFLAPAANATEASGTVNVQVVLNPAPPTNITIAYALGGDATRNEDYTASGTVTATAGDAAVTIPVSVTDDDVTEASETIVLTLEGGTGYAVGTPNTHTLTVADNDAPGVIANPLSLTINEGGLAGTYTLRLATNPGAGATVTVTPQTSDAGAATTTDALTFDSDNWQTPQPVTVTPRNDNDARNETVDITHTVAGYGSLMQGPTVTVAVADDEGARTPGVNASPLTLNLSEGGAAGTYALTLRTDPGGTVTVTPQTSDAGAVTLDTKTSTGALEFDSSDWQTPKNVTVIPEDDNDARNETVSITHTVAGYGSVTDGPQVTVAITDDDTPAVTASSLALTIEESGSDGSYAIRLATNPGAEVTVTPLSSDKQAATVSGALTFDSSNWQSPQNVRVTPVVDSNTGDETVTITHTVAGYAGITTGPVVTVTVIDATRIVSVEREQGVAEAQEKERAEKTREIPTTFALEQNYPNPFNPTTTIEYALDKTARVTLTVYDIFGRKVRTLVDDMQSAARYSIAFDANGLASGTYLYVLATGQKRAVRTMLLIK